MLAKLSSLFATYSYLDLAVTKVAQYSKAVATVMEPHPIALVGQVHDRGFDRLIWIVPKPTLKAFKAANCGIMTVQANVVFASKLPRSIQQGDIHRDQPVGRSVRQCQAKTESFTFFCVLRHTANPWLGWGLLAAGILSWRRS